MTARTARKPNLITRALRAIYTGLLWMSQPAASLTTPQQQRRGRILASYFFFLFLSIMPGAIATYQFGDPTWIPMAGAAFLFVVGYIVIRLGFYRTAVVLALAVPIVPAFARIIAFRQMPGAEASLMWAALPLLISPFLTDLRKSIFVALAYIIAIALLIAVPGVNQIILAEVMSFIITIIFFTIVIAAARRLDQSEIETQLAELQRTEKALRQSEDKFSKAFRLSPQQITITRMRDGQTIEANDSFYRLSGYTPEETIGHTADEIGVWANPGDRERLFGLILKLGRIYNEEWPFRNKDGQIRTHLVSAEIITIDNEACLLSIMTDITERKRAEEALKESEEKFSKAFRASPEAVAITSRDDGIFLEVNDSFLRQMGYTREEVIGQSSVALKIWDDEKQRRALLKTIKTKGAVSNAEYIFRTKTGQPRIWLFSADTINIDGRPCILSMTTDITERRRAEEAIRRAAQEWRTTFDSINEMIAVVDKNRKVVRANRSLARTLKTTPQELLDRECHTLFHASGEAPENCPLFEAMKTGKTSVMEYYEPHLKIYLEETVSPVVEENGEVAHYVHVARDITERKEAEEALKRSEERYRDLFDNARDLIQSVTPDGHFAYVNKAWREALEYSPEEVANLTVWDIIHPRDTLHCQEHFKKLMSGEPLNEIETTFVSKHGRSIKVAGDINVQYEGDKIVATRGIFRDITDRKEAEERLRESEERYRDLFENASDLIQSCDRDEHFIFVNKTWRDTLGYSEREVPGLVLWDIIHKDEIPKCKGIYQRVISGETINNIETVFVAKNGRLIHVEGNSNAVFKDGQVMATRSIFRDISVRKEAEEKLKKVDEMKKEFLSNISHELRTPLQSISGFTKLILDGQVPEEATRQEFLGIIDRESQLLGGLIDNLLDISRLEAGRFEVYRQPVLIGDAFAEAITTFRGLARDKNITLDAEIAPHLPEMEVDAGRLRQVITNLLSNAIKFSEPGSTIAVRAEVRDGAVVFEVSDHGIGISVKAQKHLFERFYRDEAEKVRGGTGLGLYISKQIIDAHGGRIWAKSKPGRGSTFSFSLPLGAKIPATTKGVKNHA